MSIFDIIVIALIAIAAVIGFFSGALRALLRFVEIILSIAFSALAAMCVAWFGLADLDAMQNITDLDSAMNSGALYMVIAFVVMFIVSVLLMDFAINKIVYSRKLGSILVDKLIGMVLSAILCCVFIMFIFAVLGVLEGTEFDPYLAMTKDSVITPLLFKYNPFTNLVNNMFGENLRNVIITVLNMIWPNFEYIG